MRDSREKGAGMRDQDPPSRPCIHNEQSLYTTTGQNKNDLERGSVKHAKVRLNNRPLISNKRSGWRAGLLL